MIVHYLLSREGPDFTTSITHYSKLWTIFYEAKLRACYTVSVKEPNLYTKTLEVYMSVVGYIVLD